MGIYLPHMVQNNRTVLDVTITAIRRCDILKNTLDSFEERVLSNFSVNKLLVNIDPFGGDLTEQERCISAIHSRYPDAQIFEPEVANFGAAVKRLWGQTETDIVFHMEDDWLALDDLTPGTVVPHFNDRTKVLSLMSENKNWNRKSRFDYVKKRPWYFPIRMLDRTRPKFTTSPSFWDGKFMRDCASLIDENFDPEKQFYSGVNEPLERFVKQYRNKFLIGENSECIVKDTGRRWSEKNGIDKKIINSKSIWQSDVKSESKRLLNTNDSKRHNQ